MYDYDSLYVYSILCKLQCIDEPSRTSFMKILYVISELNHAGR